MDQAQSEPAASRYEVEFVDKKGWPIPPKEARPWSHPLFWLFKQPPYLVRVIDRASGIMISEAPYWRLSRARRAFASVDDALTKMSASNFAARYDPGYQDEASN